jgi:hypothetical protein
MQIFTTLLLLLIGTFSTTAFADGRNTSRITNPQQSEVHLNRHHERSREATVKVVSQLGHGTGTYVKVGRSYGIITAAHVVDSGEHYIIQSGMHQSIATLIWTDADADIAFLITDKIDKLKPLKMVTYPGVDVGEQIIYSGFPSSHEMLTFACEIANTNYNGMLAIQGWAWFGSSGSGFINRRGHVFAVLSAVSVENFYGHPQVLETLVYGAPIHQHMIDQIDVAITEWNENH